MWQDLFQKRSSEKTRGNGPHWAVQALLRTVQKRVSRCMAHEPAWNYSVLLRVLFQILLYFTAVNIAPYRSQWMIRSYLMVGVSVCNRVLFCETICALHNTCWSSGRKFVTETQSKGKLCFLSHMLVWERCEGLVLWLWGALKDDRVFHRSIRCFWSW